MPCHICGEPIASRGFGFAGFRHERKSNAILWVCEAHIPVGEARWKAANAGPIAQDAAGRIPDGSRQSIAGKPRKGGPDSARGEEGDNGNSQQGELGL